MQNSSETKFSSDDDIHYTDSEFSYWEKIFSSENIPFSDSENEDSPQTVDDEVKDNQISVGRIAVSSKKGISPLCRTKTSRHETAPTLLWKGIKVSELCVLNETDIHTEQNKLQTVTVLGKDGIISNPREKFNERSCSENVYISSEECKKLEMFSENKISPNTVETFPNICADYTQKSFFKNQAMNIGIQENYGNQMNIPNRESLRRHSESAIVSSQESSGNQKMITSSQGSSGSQMTTSSQGSSGSQPMTTSSQGGSGNQSTIISSQESSGSQPMIISSQESSGSQPMIISSQESSGSQSMITSSQESFGSQKMIISTRGSFNSQAMNIASQTSSSSQVMNISVPESSSSTNIFNQESSGSYAIITSNQKNPINQKRIILSRQKGKSSETNISNQKTSDKEKIWINDQANSRNKTKSSKETLAKIYNFLDSHDAKKIKLITGIASTINDSVETKKNCRRCNKTETNRRNLGIRKRELLVTKRENVVKIREKLLAVREAALLKHERVIKARKRKYLSYESRMTNHFQKLTNISKKN